MSTAARYPLISNAESGEPMDQSVGNNFSTCFRRQCEPYITAVIVFENKHVYNFSLIDSCNRSQSTASCLVR